MTRKPHEKQSSTSTKDRKTLQFYQGPENTTTHFKFIQMGRGVIIFMANKSLFPNQWYPNLIFLESKSTSVEETLNKTRSNESRQTSKSSYFLFLELNSSQNQFLFYRITNYISIANFQKLKNLSSETQLRHNRFKSPKSKQKTTKIEPISKTNPASNLINPRTLCASV